MGGAISTFVCVFAAIALYGTGHPVLFSISIVITIIAFASWCNMNWVAKTNAKTRLFVQALESGAFGSKDPSSDNAKQYWNYLGTTIGMKDLNSRDVQGVPDWIGWVHTVASLAGVAMAIASVIIHPFMMSTYIKIVIVIAAGLAFFFAIGNAIDALIFRLAVGPGDPIENILADAPNPRRRFVLNIVRPVILTVLIFGGGLLTIAILGIGTRGAIGSGLWFFFLTQFACLGGRGASLKEAGWAMVITITLLTGAFIAFLR